MTHNFARMAFFGLAALTAIAAQAAASNVSHDAAAGTFKSKSTTVSVPEVSETPVYPLPYSITPTLAQFNECVINDANGDGSSWHFYGEKNAFWYKYDRNNDADDWLILPGVNPGDAEKVKIEFDASVANPNYTEKFEVYAGPNPSTTGMSLLLQCFEGLTDTFKTYTIERDITSKGKPFYIAFRALSPKDQHSIYINNIRVTDAAPAVGVDNVTADRIITAANGAIVIAGSEGETATVYTLDGRIVAREVLSANTTIPAARGIYIVKVGSAISKVIVK